MRPDIYTKAVLTVIAIMLTVIACNQYVSPAATAQAQGPLAGVQFSGYGLNFNAYDTRTGDVWRYADDSLNHKNVTVKYLGKLTKLGQAPAPNVYNQPAP